MYMRFCASLNFDALKRFRSSASQGFDAENSNQNRGRFTGAHQVTSNVTTVVKKHNGFFVSEDVKMVLKVESVNVGFCFKVLILFWLNFG
jgi:hypothetical protein